MLPLTTSDEIDKTFGTRHRAGIGITEVTDAISIIVSEEKGTVSYAYKGEFFAEMTGDTLKKALKELLK